MIGFIQGLLDGIVMVLNATFGFLPDSPIGYLINSEFDTVFAQINYFLPVYEFVVIVETWLICVFVYYAYSVVLRWLKGIQ